MHKTAVYKLIKNAVPVGLNMTILDHPLSHQAVIMHCEKVVLISKINFQRYAVSIAY
jgi:hypothetical protein